MVDRILQLAEEAALINYVDHETPRTYFICGHADLENVKSFADTVIDECIYILEKRFMGDMNREDMEVKRCIEDIRHYFYGID
jgi:hypothetical protein